MFGTDHPAGAGTLKEIYEEVRASGVAGDLERALLGETARGLVAAVRMRRDTAPIRGGRGRAGR
jgi:hypothetical protein